MESLGAAAPKVDLQGLLHRALGKAAERANGRAQERASSWSPERARGASAALALQALAREGRARAKAKARLALLPYQQADAVTRRDLRNEIGTTQMARAWRTFSRELRWMA